MRSIYDLHIVKSNIQLPSVTDKSEIIRMDIVATMPGKWLEKFGCCARKEKLAK